MEELKALINEVVEARGKAKEANNQRTEAYQKWVETNQSLLDNEKVAKDTCQEAETKLRGMALLSYALTGDKVVAPGVGIRVMTKLSYDAKDAMEWATKHQLALRLDIAAFEKMAKMNNLPFVIITEEPQATLAAELHKVE